MCKLMEDFGEKIRERSMAEGRHEAAKTIALNMWNGGYKSIEKISEITKLSIDEIKKLIDAKPI